MCTRPKWNLDASLFFRDAIQTFSSHWRWSSCIHANCTQMERQFSLRTIRIRRGVFSLSAILSVLLSISIHGMVEKCFSRLHTRKRCELVFFLFWRCLRTPATSTVFSSNISILFLESCASKISVIFSHSVKPCGHQGLFIATTHPFSARPTFTEIDFLFFFFKKKKRNFLRLCGGRCWFAW